jgi:hypothetical protein
MYFDDYIDLYIVEDDDYTTYYTYYYYLEKYIDPAEGDIYTTGYYESSSDDYYNYWWRFYGYYDYLWYDDQAYAYSSYQETYQDVDGKTQIYYSYTYSHGDTTYRGAFYYATDYVYDLYGYYNYYYYDVYLYDYYDTALVTFDSDLAVAEVQSASTRSGEGSSSVEGASDVDDPSLKLILEVDSQLSGSVSENYYDGYSEQDLRQHVHGAFSAAVWANGFIAIGVISAFFD